MSKCEKGQTFPRPLSLCHRVTELEGFPGLMGSVHHPHGKTGDNHALPEKG